MTHVDHGLLKRGRDLKTAYCQYEFCAEREMGKKKVKHNKTEMLEISGFMLCCQKCVDNFLILNNDVLSTMQELVNSYKSL